MANFNAKTSRAVLVAGGAGCEFYTMEDGASAAKRFISVLPPRAMVVPMSSLAALCLTQLEQAFLCPPKLLAKILISRGTRVESGVQIIISLDVKVQINALSVQFMT